MRRLRLRLLQDPWWATTCYSDRQYSRVVTADDQIFALYHYRVSDLWVLDVVQDWSTAVRGVETAAMQVHVDVTWRHMASATLQ